MKKLLITMWVLAMFLTSPVARAEVIIDGFVQGLVAGRTDDSNPTSTEMPAAETRLQLRTAHYGDRGEVFTRLDLFWDGSDTSEYDWELREAYLKFRMGSAFDFKIGRQVLTWGTGDLIFINDVFAKDYQSFFIGRDDQYLKAPQNAFRAEWYPGFGNLSVVWTPRFEGNRLPTGTRLSYYNPTADNFEGAIVGVGTDPMFFFDPPAPPAKFKNSEIATRFQRRIAGFATAAYFYKGFYKNPQGFDPQSMTVFYPELHLYGLSARGQVQGGILWIEGGYYDSRDDTDGDNPFVPNRSIVGLIGYERQVANNLTVNAQWQADYMIDHDKYEASQRGLEQQFGITQYIREEVRHLVTSRITKLLYNELVTVSAFGFYSPTDEDYYVRGSVAYKYTDEIELAGGGNLFGGDNIETEFGQFQFNDNLWLKLTYGFY